MSANADDAADGALLETADDDLSTALALAAAEGLTLIRADNATGFLGVSQGGSGAGSAFRVRIKHGAADVTLGSFPTAAEAALCYARHLGPAGCQRLAARQPRKRPQAERGVPTGFGVPRIDLRTVAPAVSAVDPLVIECRVVDGEDGGAVNGADEAATPLVGECDETRASPPLPLPPPAAASLADPPTASSDAPPYKRVRTTRTDEYEVRIAAGDRTIVLPVPLAAVGGGVVHVSVRYNVE